MRAAQPQAHGFVSLPQLFAEARAANITVRVALSPRDTETTRALAKRRHDVKASLRTFRFTLKALESGYRFDDDMATAKLEAISRALQVLEKEAPLLDEILATD